jgi:hypothetical protein
MGKRIPLEEDLLRDLDDVCNYVIGNVPPEDLSFNQTSTLGEALSYVMIYSNTESAVKDAIKKMKILQDKIDIIHKKLKLLEYRNNNRKIQQ